MKKIILTLLIPLAFSFQMVIAQNAPISTIGNVVSYGTTAVVPITVTGFTEIGACDLLFYYDQTVATVTSVSLGPGVPYAFFAPNTLTPGQIKIGWVFFQAGIPGLTLPDNSVFLNITFEKVDYGYSALDFDLSGPYSCEWYDWDWNPLLDTPNEDYYLDGSVTFASGSTQWTGNSDDDWSDALNWTAGVPGATSIAIINDVVPNLFPSASTNAECLGLDIALGASVTVPVSSALTVHGNFSNNWQFTVESTDAGDGSFINNGAISGSGSFSIQRYLSSEKWHYVSPPVSDAVSNMFFDIYLMDWDEPSGAWTFITAIDEGLNAMQGYASWTDDDILGPETVSYDGILNTGSINSGVLTSDGPAGGASDPRGFNFVGNPYPSAIDWDAANGWEKTDIANTIYIWNPTMGQYGSYVGTTGTSTNDVTNIIPSGQGFFVHVPTDFSTGSLTVNNKARLHDSKPFFKSGTDNKLVKLEISSELNTYSDQSVVLFNEFATENFDPAYDAYDILAGLAEAPSLCSVTEENQLSINTLPETGQDVTIPLKFSVGVNGVYDIEALEIENLENNYVYLKDHQENILTDLNSQAVYSFFGDVGDNPNRFELFIHNSPLGIEDFTQANNLNIYSDKNVVYLISNENIFSGDLNIYDLAGKSVYNEQLQNSTNFEATLNVEKGFYIVKLVTNNTIITEKVFIAK